MYEDIISKRLKEFWNLLLSFQACEAIVKKLQIAASSSESKIPSRLKMLCFPREEGGHFPDLGKLNNIFLEDYIERKEENDGIVFNLKLESHDELLSDRGDRPFGHSPLILFRAF